MDRSGSEGSGEEWQERNGNLKHGGNMTDIQKELARLTKLGGGILKAEAVVEAAKSKKNPLHDSFNWDDTSAAELWRLRQAREIIRVTVIVMEGDSEPIRAYASLMADRTQDGGGFRSMVAVLSDKDTRAQLLEEALSELDAMKARYGRLKELAAVFAAASKVRKRKVA